MPIYVFKHPEKEEYREVVQRMKEKREYSEDGIEWEHVFLNPQIDVRSTIDPFSPQQFSEVTGKQRGTYGDVLDRSRDLSEERMKITGGEDPVKDKFFKKYRADRNGRPHPKDPDQKQATTNKYKRKS